MPGPSGAFTAISGAYSSDVLTGELYGWSRYSINSSRSSSIYQSGGTIRPVSRQVRFIIKY